MNDIHHCNVETNPLRYECSICGGSQLIRVPLTGNILNPAAAAFLALHHDCPTRDLPRHD